MRVSLVTVRSSLKNNFCQASRGWVLARGPKPNRELLEKNCFLRRFHRKVAHSHSETLHCKAVALRDPALRGSGTQTPGAPSRHHVFPCVTFLFALPLMFVPSEV